MSTQMSRTVSVRLDDGLEEQLDEYMENFDRFEPNQSDVIREALREFLESEATAEA